MFVFFVIVTLFIYFSSSRHSNRACWPDSSTLEDEDPRIKSKNRVRSRDLSIFSLGEDENDFTWTFLSRARTDMRDVWCVICVCVYLWCIWTIIFHSIFTLCWSHSIITDERSIFFLNAALLWFEMRMHWSFTNTDQTNKKSTLLTLTTLHPFNNEKIQC